MGLRNLSDSIDSGRTDSQNILLERTEGKVTNPVAFTGTPPPVFNLSGDTAKEVVEKLSGYSKTNENNSDIQ